MTSKAFSSANPPHPVKNIPATYLYWGSPAKGKDLWIYPVVVARKGTATEPGQSGELPTIAVNRVSDAGDGAKRPFVITYSVITKDGSTVKREMTRGTMSDALDWVASVITSAHVRWTAKVAAKGKGDGDNVKPISDGETLA